MKKNLLIASVILLTLSGCVRSKYVKVQNVNVKTDTVTLYGTESSENYPGKIRAASDIDIAFRVSGTLLNIPVREGSFVKKGDLIAEIDPRDYKIQLSATEAEYNQVKGEAERVISLYEKGSVSQNDYEKAVYGLQQITAKYNAHKNALSDTKLTAPFSGYVQTVSFHENETVSAGLPVISMINNSLPEVEINIPSSEYIKRGTFKNFYCTVDVYKDQEFPLELISIAKKANLNQLYTVRLRMKSANGNIPTPGMSTMVYIEYKSQESNLTSIPMSSVFNKGEDEYVWIFNNTDSTVSSRKVTPHEILIDGICVISDGLKAGDIIITAGVNSLKEGEKVSPVAPVTKTNIGGLI